MTVTITPIEVLEKERATIDARLRATTEKRASLQLAVEEQIADIDKLDQDLLRDMNSLEAFDATLEIARAGKPVAIDREGAINVDQVEANRMAAEGPAARFENAQQLEAAQRGVLADKAFNPDPNVKPAGDGVLGALDRLGQTQAGGEFT